VQAARLHSFRVAICTTTKTENSARPRNFFPSPRFKPLVNCVPSTPRRRMTCRFVASAALLLIGLSFAQADEFTGTLLKVADGKLTFSRGTGKKKKKEFTLPVDEKCRVVAGVYDAKTKMINAGDDIAGGLKNPIFENLDKESVDAWIRTTTQNDRILELRLFQSTKKKVK